MARYIQYLEDNLNISHARQDGQRLVVVDAANRFPRCLRTEGYKEVLYYNFRGNTDVLIAMKEAFLAGVPESASVGGIELKKQEVCRLYLFTLHNYVFQANSS